MSENSRGGEAAGGVALLAAAVIALVWANSPFAASYQLAIHHPITLGTLHTSWTLRRFVDDGLMTIFFFAVGMEIKRELVMGELRTLRHAALPAIGALGGMVVPVLIFSLINHGGAGARGWGIPMATDIAFALGCIALVRKYVPTSIAVFLLALAIFDDLGAILVIAVFYGHGLDPVGLGLGVLVLGVLVAMNRANMDGPAIYVAVGFVLWIAILRSGIHPTFAGVLLGLCIPVRPIAGAAISPLDRLQAAIKGAVAFVIVPLFALTNAGIALRNVGVSGLISPVALGVVLGLSVGKGVGVFLFSSAAVRLRIALPLEGAGPRHLAGVSVLAGIGFTMSIFIAALSFEPDSPLLLEAKLGILVASALSAAAGVFILRSGHPYGAGLRESPAASLSP